MESVHVVVLLGGGLVAGIINAMAGRGSLLTVPLLVATPCWHPLELLV